MRDARDMPSIDACKPFIFIRISISAKHTRSPHALGAREGRIRQVVAQRGLLRVRLRAGRRPYCGNRFITSSRGILHAATCF